MNTTAKALVFAIVTVASAASIGMSPAATQPARDIVKLERVVIVGKRAEAPVLAQLPRVVIVGRRAAPADVQMAAVKQPAKTI